MKEQKLREESRNWVAVSIVIAVLVWYYTSGIYDSPAYTNLRSLYGSFSKIFCGEYLWFYWLFYVRWTFFFSET